LSAGELDELLRRARFQVEQLAGLHHGPGVDDSIIDAQIRFALSGAPWPAELLAEVSAVTVDDFVITGDDLDGSLDLVAVARR
jgi:hypothetical protein